MRVMAVDTSSSPPDARFPYIDALVRRAIQAGASDIHIEPTLAGAEVRLRIDGLLRPADVLSADSGRGLRCCV